MRFMSVLIIVSFLAAPIAARADETVSNGPPSTVLLAAPPPVKPRTESYAHLTLISDGVAAGLIAVGISAMAYNETDDVSPAAFLAVAGLGVYLLGAPLVHGATKNKATPQAGFFSFITRLGLPMLVGGLAYGASNDASLAVIGASGGMMLASILDAAFLARVRVVDTAPRVAPMVTAGPQGFSAGLGGRF